MPRRQHSAYVSTAARDKDAGQDYYGERLRMHGYKTVSAIKMSSAMLMKVSIFPLKLSVIGATVLITSGFMPPSNAALVNAWVDVEQQET